MKTSKSSLALYLFGGGSGVGGGGGGGGGGGVGFGGEDSEYDFSRCCYTGITRIMEQFSGMQPLSTFISH